MPTAGAMDFFAHQDVARRKTSLLIAYYVLAVLCIMFAVYLAVTLVFASAGSEVVEASRSLWDPARFLGVMIVTGGIVLIGTLYKIVQLGGGGEAVATMLGGRPLQRNAPDLGERRLLNVVEEMAIAAGTPVPRVFVMDEEDGINAFAAGFTPSDAVIGVTRGTIRHLSRDELQGVIAHEFSHILNGDMRLNIRLIGVLNGILVIALIGYWIFRSTLRTGRVPVRSRKGKGNGLPIVVFGLLLMAIGYIGVFFGKLIKSAVSRQREYLADASAVQFTRNPSGIANALKKIGGFLRGSRLETSHAEEASHLFFSNGLAEAWFGLMATHPPLTERIRRLEPSFSGDMEVPPPAGEPAEAQPGAARLVAEAPRSPAAPVARRARKFDAAPDAVVAGVGAPTAEHVEYAARLVASLPPSVEQAAREPSGARAVVYGLLLSREPEPRQRQLEHLAALADPAAHRELLALTEPLVALGPEVRLPLVDLAIASLKSLSPEQYAQFREDVRQLVAADQQIDLFEYALQRMLARHLEPAFGKPRRSAIQFYDLAPVEPYALKLLSCLAYWGCDDRAEALAAFGRGVERLQEGAAEPVPLEECGLQAVDECLDVLVQTSPTLKRRILEACVACVAADAQVTVEEAELLRSVADSLDCPIPPFLPGQAA